MAVAASESEPYTKYQAAIQKQLFDGQYTAHSVIVTLCIALALYNSLEMVLLISTTFKRWKGLYFWSLSICNFGVVLYTLGMMLLYFNISVLWLGKFLNDAGWMAMIICQSLVLYSRLGLILDNVKILRAVKWMIIVDSVLLICSTITLDLGTTYSKNPAFAQGYFYIEHIQMTCFTLQEIIISGLYVWKTVRFLEVLSKANTRSMVQQLLVINIIIIGMDVGLVVLQFKKLQLYQECIKAFVYSVKLKLELNILSKLVDLVHGSSASRSMTLDIIDSNTIPGQAQAAVQREMSRRENLGNWLVNDDKGAMKHIEDSNGTEPRLSSSISRPPGDTDEITRILSQNSRFTARTSDRQSDILYADALRSLK